VLILSGLLAITVLTVATGYFVALEFAYLAVNRGRLRHMADGGDKAAERAYQVTQRLSFMLSGAQFGITVTALLAGYVAEPLLGSGLADLLGLVGVPQAVSVAVSVALALVFATAVQMVLGELFPKNVAIAKPEALAKALSRSTLMYLKVAGPLIRFFDATANRLLRAVGIEPVEELPQGATEADLQRIIDDSEAGGHLDPELSSLLDRGLDFRSIHAAVDKLLARYEPGDTVTTRPSGAPRQSAADHPTAARASSKVGASGDASNTRSPLSELGAD
jgi:CBS domain containing-hemolysin-like protein